MGSDPSGPLRTPRSRVMQGASGWGRAISPSSELPSGGPHRFSHPASSVSSSPRHPKPLPTAADARLERPNALAAAHARFARAALAIYLATAAVSVALLIAAVVTDRAH